MKAATYIVKRKWKIAVDKITIAFVRYVSESQTLERTGMELAVSYL